MVNSVQPPKQDMTKESEHESNRQIVITVYDVHSKMPNTNRMPVEYYIEESIIAIEELVARENRRRIWSPKKDNSPNPFVKIRINDVWSRIRRSNNHPLPVEDFLAKFRKESGNILDRERKRREMAIKY